MSIIFDYYSFKETQEGFMLYFNDHEYGEEIRGTRAKCTPEQLHLFESIVKENEEKALLYDELRRNHPELFL